MFLYFQGKAKLDKLCQKLIAKVKRDDPDFDIKRNMPEFIDLVSN